MEKLDTSKKAQGFLILTRVFMELVWPLILFLILMWVRTRGLKINRASCHLVEKPMPSVGGFEFLQNFFCTLNNTCYEDYVESRGSKMWDDALGTRFIKEVAPLMQEILVNPNANSTLRKLWSDITLYIKVVSTFRAQTRFHGKIKLKELMEPDGRDEFLLKAPGYTGLTTDELTELLDSEVNLDAVNRKTVDQILDDLQNGKCDPSKKYDVIKLTPTLHKALCGLERQQAFLLVFVFTNYVDNQKLAKKLQIDLQTDDLLQQLTGPRISEYDLNTLATIGKLGGVLQNFDGISKQFSTNDTGATASLIYESLCGVRLRGNSSSFAVDPDSTNRYDSLRDRLKDINPDHHYEADPNISATCNIIFQRLELMGYTSLLWRQVKPFIRGVIYFSPDTPITREIMRGVDLKFSKLRQFEVGLKIGLNVLHRARQWLRQNSYDISLAKEVISDPENLKRVLALANTSLDTEALDRISSILDAINRVDIDVTLQRADFTAELLQEIFSCINYNKSKGFATEWEAVNAGIELLSVDKLWAVVIFTNVNESDSLPKHVHYKIRMDSDKVDGTRNARDRLTSKSPRRRPAFDLKYITNGFAYLQEMIEQTIIEKFTGPVSDGLMIYLQQFPYPCYIHDQFIRAISRTFPLFMVLSWVYASSMIVKSIVLEKEFKLKEVMRVMGLGNTVIWTGWFVDSFVTMSISATILSLILKYGKVIEHSDFWLIWIFMISFTVATIFFSFFVSTFFTRANSAAAAGGILFFVMYLPYNFLLIWEEKLTWHHMLGGCLISNVAFGFGCTYFSRFEEDGVGAQWDSITWRTLPGDDFNLSYCIAMLWFDSLLYWVLTWYIEAVYPGESGMPKPWNFCLKRSYWLRQRSENVFQPSSYQSVPSSQHTDEDSPVIEPEPEGLKKGIVCTNLSKTYSNGKIALTDLNVTFYEGQICSFLGHNGAGKSTTISILTGLFPPSSGTATIYGQDICTDMDSIRSNLGICPQFNVLFDRLNVEEHLQFYAGLKGRSKRSLSDEIPSMLHDLGIPHKRHEFPRNLSGGMKRKLSVAIAFVGGSKTVFIDEATSGVDPHSRRSIWELLLKYKEGRTIVLTTHFMDEADLLGDRIAIISQGKLKACGTGLFLKSHYGQGYSLRLVKRESELFGHYSEPPFNGCGRASTSQPGINCSRTEQLHRFVRLRIQGTTLVDDVGSEVVLLLPYESIQQFPILFNDLDDNLEDLGISSYGISDTTLEDVFLKITFEDLNMNSESFSALNSSCKRRFAKMFERFRSHLNRNPLVLHVDPPIAVIENGITPTPTNVPEVDNTNLNGVCNGNAKEAEVVLLEEGTLEELPVGSPSSGRVGRCFQFFIQIWMINLKRFRNSRRNKKAMFFEIILPAVFIAITLAFTLILPPSEDEPIREITPWTYPSPNNIFFSAPNVKSDRFQKFSNTIDELIGPIGLGTACLKDQKYTDLCTSKWSFEAVVVFNTSRLQYKRQVLKQCSCKSGSLHCPSNVEGVKPPTLRSPTNDLIMDVSKVNIPEWLTKTYRLYEGSRYGGFEFQSREKMGVNYTEFVILVDSFTKLQPLPVDGTKNEQKQWGIVDSKEKFPAYKVWFENRGWVSSVAYLNALHNMYLRESLPATESDNKNEYGITLYSHPLNLTKSQQIKESIKVAGLGVIHAICIIFALSFVPASFTVYLIEERKCGGKHLHLVSGVKPIIYWVANFLFDMTKYTVPVILSLILFIIFDARAYVSKESICSFTALLFLYGWSSIPLMYPASYLFGIPSTAFVVLACTNLFIGVVTTVSTFVLEQFGDKELEEIGHVLKQVFLIFPHYCLGRGLIELVSLDIQATALHRLAIYSTPANRFAWDHLGKMLLSLFIQGIVFFVINLSMEYKQICHLVFKRKRRTYAHGAHDDDDEDVKRETVRVLGQPHLDSTLVAENLTKYYFGLKSPSVNGLCFAIEKGECFGLLGVNGAGKTSTFKMLTGDVRISGGNAKICGHDVETSLDGARQHFGYCPQDDGLDPLLNAHEQLQLYGRLRGMSPKDTKLAADKLIKVLGLSAYAGRKCGTYSGGNKRKMSTAISLIGDPDVVFLDEPTSGMDPGARRNLWKVILRLIHLRKSVVLTSHSMEECEALCTKLAIMVNGKFMCLGSLQHLKNRFGTGYTLTVRCTKENQNSFLEYLKDSLPTAALEDFHCSQMKFKIPQHEAKLSDIFNVMYSAKKCNLLEDYSVSQTTLDDIFVKFASQQKDNMDR